jgi:hypothetical protein
MNENESDNAAQCGEPLGYPVCVRTELGPNVVEYFRRKHASGAVGTYWLHETAIPVAGLRRFSERD